MKSLLLAMTWWFATKDYRLVDEDIHPFTVKGMMVNLLLVSFVFAIFIVVSFFDLRIAHYLWITIIPLNIAIKRKYKH